MSLLFIVQLSVSIGALAITTDQQNELLRTAWNKAARTDKNELQNKLDCCGFESNNFTVGPKNPSCSMVSYHPQYLFSVQFLILWLFAFRW